MVVALERDVVVIVTVIVPVTVVVAGPWVVVVTGPWVDVDEPWVVVVIELEIKTIQRYTISCKL
jgi:hypothetical protein